MTEETKTDVVEEVKTEVAIETKELVEKADDLIDIKSAVTAVQAENVELKSAADMSTAKVTNLETELAAKAEQIEELEAKAAAPSLIISKDTNIMTAPNHFKTFMTEGVDGLRHKGADLQISVDAQGGFALPEELRREIIRLEHDISPLRGVANVTSSSTTDVKQLVSIGAAASGWVGETAARAQTGAPELAQRTATFGEVYARPRIYQHMLEDSFFDVEAWLTGEVARQFAEVEGQAFLTGDGNNKPKGILDGLTLGTSAANNDTNGTYEVIQAAGDGVLGETDGAIIDFLRGVVLSMKTGYLAGSKWMMTRATHDILVNMKNADGEYFLQRDITAAAASRLFGYEIVINEDMDSMPTENGSKAPVFFGNFKRGYQIIDRVGVSMLRDPYTNMGSVMFYTRKRTGSMVLDAGAIKVVSVTKGG